MDLLHFGLSEAARKGRFFIAFIVRNHKDRGTSTPFVRKVHYSFAKGIAIDAFFLLVFH